MHNQDLIFDIIPKDLFDIRREGKNLYFVCDFFMPDGKRAAQAKYHYVLAGF